MLGAGWSRCRWCATRMGCTGWTWPVWSGRSPAARRRICCVARTTRSAGCGRGPSWRRWPHSPTGIGEEVAYGAGLFGAVANTVAFDAGEPWLDELLVALHANRDRLGTLLGEHLPALRWRPEDAQATYLAWLDCSPLGYDDPAGVFEQRGRVALEPGPLYGTGGDGYVRLNFATTPAVLDQAVQRMRAAIPPAEES